jgi:hypothetical protein
MKRIQGLWFLALLGGFISCLALGWLVQAKQNYSYDFWYDWYDIGAHIERFGPQNRYVAGLEQLDKAEHMRLFDEISVAVHSQGRGLADIQFEHNDQAVGLLRRAEIIHLQDVANLIDAISVASWVIALITLFLLIALLWLRTAPLWKQQLFWLLGALLVTGFAVLIIGPKEVFYQLHVWIFPDNHQWFFYYQESLMSTLMKAPVLFGGIALAIIAGGVLFFALFVLLLRWGLRFRSGVVPA